MIARLLPFFASLLTSTLRIRWNGGPLPERAVVVFWHGKMIAGWWSVRRMKPVGLVSQSEDGALLAAVLKAWYYIVVRGSSSKQGWEAMNIAIEHVRNGGRDALVITPDGPRGPREIFKRGAFVAARELGLPLIHLEIEYANAKRLSRSWDRFEVPLPFSRVTITPMEIGLTDFPEERELQYAWLEQRSGAFNSPDAEGAGEQSSNPSPIPV